MAHMLRCLFFLEARFQLTLTAAHIPGVDNRAADAISRNRLELFFDLIPQAQRSPSPVPGELVQRLVAQEQWTSDAWRRWSEALLILQ